MDGLDDRICSNGRTCLYLTSLDIPNSGKQHDRPCMSLATVLSCFALPATIWTWVSRLIQQSLAPATRTVATKVVATETDATKTTKTTGMTTSVHKSTCKPSSPCFVEALHDNQRTGPAVDALMKCQRTLIQHYVTLGMRGIFTMSISNKPVVAYCEVHGHPIQDPTGALMAAMLILRRNRPGEDSWMEPPYEMNLRIDTRRTLAAMLTVCQKMTVAQTGLTYHQYVHYITSLFLLPQELPKWRNDWVAEYKLFDRAELDVLMQEPLLAIFTNNPLSEAEVVISELVVTKQITTEQASVLRGGCFFLLGSCMLNADEDVLERLNEQASLHTIGQGVVSLLLALYHSAAVRAGREPLYLPPLRPAVDRVAQIMLDNATSGYANQLRIGPYRANALGSDPPHIVQQMLSPANLALARNVFKKSGRELCAMPLE